MNKTTIAKVMAELGRRGGPARKRALPPERRREIARLGGLVKAANWRAKKKSKGNR